ncbi:unnamed protein product [Microthlaspi erraticum]|uniref:Uncharacterized protein n=1 Tax=Microthlaspi erraticum TaxID=1685480 RepID=A0A6D2JSZ3_9BRAS|nr:unnamed protein product [Microthlaspi erraticum]
MEAFEHMIVDEFNEEDFYETIEAPKFVDLTAPDHRPQGDDRYWFCSRVGCDQKHEEFMDSEAIYQKFVLRVMAARSPSVRLRKALYKKDFSVELKCPNTVPAKPSRSRVARLAMISSIPHKANNNMRSKEAKVICTNKNATPKAKVKGKESSKAFTERKTKTLMQSPSPAAAFRSVQNPTTSRVTPQKRVVAKALVFHSPNKLVKLKTSVELKKLCNGMRKLGIDSQTRGGLGVETCKRPRKGRDVKSRVFDSLRPKTQQIDEKAKGSGTLKQRINGKEEPLLSSVPLKSNEANGMILENEESLVVVEKKSEGKQNQIAETEDKENALALEEKNATDVKREAVSVTEESGEDKAKQYETREIEDKENASPFKCDDDKENSSALDNNRCRKVDQATYPLLKKKVFGKKETTQKAMTVAADKCFNGKTVSANNRLKYTKPKLTNPKPFRLRTNERGILKEANTDKKPQFALPKEEGAECTNILRPVRLEKNTTPRSKAFRGTSTTTTLVGHDASDNMVNGKRVALGTKKKVASKTIETSLGRKGESKEAAVINKPYVCGVASVEKRPATIPKGPNFHSIHVPKSCTKRVASQV